MYSYRTYKDLKYNREVLRDRLKTAEALNVKPDYSKEIAAIQAAGSSLVLPFCSLLKESAQLCQFPGE